MTLALLASWTLRASLLLLAGLAAARAPRLSAASRHGVLAAAIGAALLVPAVSAVVPPLPIAPAMPRTLQPRTPADSPAITVDTTFVLPQTTAALRVDSSSGGRSLPLLGLMVMLAAGTLARLTILGVSLARLRRLGQAARLVSAPIWLDELHRVAAGRTRISRVRLLSGERHAPIVTWGWRRPRILLPDGAGTWDRERIRIVLAHECAHIARADWLAQMAAECLRALWWFNPLVWSIVSRLRFESERACDDLVVARGVTPTDYADHLVDLARSQPQWPHAATAMAHPSTLERRISAMLDTRLPHGPMSRLARLSTALCGLGLTVFVASLTAQSNFATLNGIVHDPLGGTIPRVTMKVVHAESGARHEVTSNAAGQFEFVGLPAGNYTLEAGVPGFRAFTVPLQLAAGGSLRRDVTLDIGQLQETITVRDEPEATQATAGTRNSRPVTRSQPRPQPACTTAPNSGGLRPPTKTRDVRPEYPGAHHASGAEAVVTLRAVIGTDGTVGTVDTVDAPAIEFAESAKDAVRQWRFTPTLLNCVPVEVQMNVSVLFKP